MKRVTYQLTTLAVSFVLLNCTPENDGGDSQVLSELPLEQRKRLVSNYQKIKQLAISGNKDIIQSIIRTDFTTLDDLEKTYLIKYAIENGDCEDPNKEDEIGETPLLWAISTQVTSVVEMLVKQEGIDLNKKNKYGKTPLAYAKDRSAIDIVKLLIKNGADVNEEYNDYEETILSYAFSVDDTELIHLGIEKSHPDNLNKYNGKIGIRLFEALALSSTDPSKQNRFIEIAKLFINKEGVNLNITNFYGSTPLHWIISCARNEKSPEIKKAFFEIAKLLIAKENFDTNTQDNYGYTPLHSIILRVSDEKSPEIKKAFFEIAKLLIAKENFDANTQDNYKCTPLDIAKTYSVSDIIELLEYKSCS